MKTIEWSFPDMKAGFPSGPWMNEPDKMQWTDPTTGFPCLIHRSRLGNWCGYVGVASNHPDYGVDYDDVGADVHGGLTYSDKCRAPRPAKPEGFGVCHVVEPGDDDDVWWFGFDTAHLFDYVPGMHRAELAALGISDLDEDDTYRDIGYVRMEVGRLAGQLAERVKGND